MRPPLDIGMRVQLTREVWEACRVGDDLRVPTRAIQAATGKEEIPMGMRFGEIIGKTPPSLRRRGEDLWLVRHDVPGVEPILWADSCLAPESEPYFSPEFLSSAGYGIVETVQLVDYQYQLPEPAYVALEGEDSDFASRFSAALKAKA